jgi:purine nucleosidase
VPLDQRHAVDLIIELLMQSSGDITLVPTGPLTNIAMALRKEPRIVKKVHEVVLMGGAYTRGNTTPAAEFNIAVDPEAAAVVFTAGWPLTMVGLDLTHQALATPAVLQRIAALGTPISKIAVQLMEFFRETYRRNAGFDSPPVHDPCAVARVIDPSVMTCVDAHVAVETRGEFTSGMTVTDFAGRLGQKNVHVATKLDVDRFWNLMVDAIERIGASRVRAS